MPMDNSSAMGVQGCIPLSAPIPGVGEVCSTFVILALQCLVVVRHLGPFFPRPRAQDLCEHFHTSG